LIPDSLLSQSYRIHDCREEKHLGKTRKCDVVESIDLEYQHHLEPSLFCAMCFMKVNLVAKNAAV
jgi:hypothetical protein